MGKAEQANLNGVKVLVCGGRDYTNREELFAAMDELHQEYGITMVIHGDARGADKLAGAWAASRGIHYAAVPALWDFYDRSAGPMRNAAMLTLRPILCIAFPGGAGTAGMMRMAETAHIPVIKPVNREREVTLRQRVVEAGIDAEEEHGREEDDDGR